MEEDKDKLGGTNDNDSSVLSSNDDLADEALDEAGQKAGKAVETVEAVVRDTQKIASASERLAATKGLDVGAWIELIVGAFDLIIKVVLPVLIVVALIILAIFCSLTASSESSVESWYKDYKSDQEETNQELKGDTAYEQGIFDYNYLYQDDLANPTDQKEKEKQAIYYNAVYQAYEMYKSGKVGGGFWGEFKNWFNNLFSPLTSDVPMLSKNDTYKVNIDFSLMTSTLYSNRMYTQTFSKDKQENFLKSLEQAASNVKYYDLHTTKFRDKIEKEYFELALLDEEFLSDDANARVGIDAIQILSKYMIQRTETYYTLIDDIAGVAYDYTRNIKIVNNLVSENCQKYIIGKGSAEVKLHRGTNNSYSWVPESKYDEDSDEYKELRSCKGRYPLDKVDNAKFNSDDDVESGYLAKTYSLDCAGYKEYLLGNYPTKDSIEEFGGEDTYFSTFIPIYYHGYVLGNKLTKESFEEVDTSYRTNEIVNDIYSMFDFYQNSTGNYSYCSANYKKSDGDLSCGEGGAGGSAGSGCNYDSYDIYVYDKSGKTIAGPMSMGEYLTRVSYAEIGHMFSAGNNRDEIIKANMIIAKTYMLYHLNRGSNGATVDTASNAIHVLGAGSGGFQAFSTKNISNLDHYVSLYNSISNYVLLDKSGGGIFNANYAGCTSKNTDKGIQNILYAFGDRSYGGNSSALNALKKSGINYQNASFSSIINYIISVGATNYNCSIDNYYSNAILGTCTQASTGPGYGGGGGSGDLPSLDLPNATHTLDFYTQSTSSIGVSKANIKFDGVTVSPTDVYCAPASLSMIINYFGNFMPINSAFNGKAAPSYNGQAIDELFCAKQGVSQSNCTKMMTVVKLGKYLIDRGLEHPTNGALGAVSDGSWITSFGVKQIARVTRPSIANISSYLNQGYLIIGHVSHHYVVIYGYENGKIYYHDPASQSGANLSTTNLMFGYTESRKSELYEYYVFGRA